MRRSAPAGATWGLGAGRAVGTAGAVEGRGLGVGAGIAVGCGTAAAVTGQSSPSARVAAWHPSCRPSPWSALTVTGQAMPMTTSAIHASESRPIAANSCKGGEGGGP